ncbi:MAG TPA: hypothetical protein VN549_00210 [Negativicutes bacterium]|nr:hypothetical protein [Negativicutes bacterium]
MPDLVISVIQALTSTNMVVYKSVTADTLPEGNVLLGFRYWTDTNTGGIGFLVDDIDITGYDVDGAELDAGWTFKGFKASTGTESKLYNHYYVAEYRTYLGYDSTLRDGPYFFGCSNDPVMANYIDHFSYQYGLLINYWDTSQSNNQTRLHPGAGLLLPVDAHYDTLYNVNGARWRNRIQTYDSTFSLFDTPGISDIHVNGVLSKVSSLPAASVFNDSNLYYDPANPQGSVINPNTGTVIVIRQQNKSNKPPFMEIQVHPAK